MPENSAAAGPEESAPRSRDTQRADGLGWLQAAGIVYSRLVHRGETVYLSRTLHEGGAGRRRARGPPYLIAGRRTRWTPCAARRAQDQLASLAVLNGIETIETVALAMTAPGGQSCVSRYPLNRAACRVVGCL
jgi:hypothetical protein